MKNHILLIMFAMLLTSKNSHAQWTLITPGGGIIAELRSAYFFNSNEGFVAGSDTMILKTTDAGQSWSTVPSNADTLRCITFTDDTTGYAVGAKGKIVQTTDRGNTWINQVSGVSSLLRSVHFPSHDIGYVAGGNGTILKTIDGGANWMQQVSGTTQDLISIRFTSVDTGYTVSSLSTFLGGLILKTVDGGANWDTVYTHVNGFLSVFPVSNDTVFAVGGAGTIVKTVDGGTNWLPLVTGDVNTLRASFFLTADSGYVAGELGKLFFTGDGGNSWVDQSIQAVGLLGLYFPMSDTGYAVGNAGTILRYSKPCLQAAEPAQIFGGTTVCQGDTISYYISPVANAIGYTWTGTPGSSVISGQGDTLANIVFAGTSGNISVTADNQCGSSAPHLLTVIVNPLPQAPVISVSGQALVTAAANAWQWFFNGNLIAGADSALYVPLQNGSYSVMVTNAFGCTASSASFSVVNAGIREINDESCVIMPLPFGTSFILTLAHPLPADGDHRLIIYNMEGMKLMETRLAGVQTYVDASNLALGMYFYEVLDKNQQIAFRGKLMKQ